jgi:type IV secretory pathway TrbD component
VSSRLSIEGKALGIQSMLCPCCGVSIFCGARECACGARFVGEPLDETPIKVQRFGPAMTSLAMLLLLITAGLIATKWLAFGAVLVMWAAWRAVKLARRDPEWYGGYRTAVFTLAVTIAGSVGLASYGIAHIPQALDNYRIRRIAATEAAMYHVANQLEEYKRSFGSYPNNAQEYKKATGQSLPADYWDQSIKYDGSTGEIAEPTESIARTGLPVNHFELRSAGSDGIIGTDDDIIMRDGIFFTNAEVKRQPLAQQLR